MLKHRVIPSLLLQNGGLVKTKKFKDAKYVGDPINAIRIFNEKEVDELMLVDISASREKRGPNFDLVDAIAGECFMPLCYGGGIRTVEEAAQLFRLGVEKISLQTAALDDLTLIRKLADRFGSQSIVASIDLKKNWRGQPCLYAAAQRKTLLKPWMQIMKDFVEAGAGEILLNSVDRDGSMEGMDLAIIKNASQSINVPLIAVGGVGSLDDIKDAIDAGADAVAAGAYFVFHGTHRAVLITYPKYQQLESLLGH
jgi:cyclase